MAANLEPLSPYWYEFNIAHGRKAYIIYTVSFITKHRMRYKTSSKRIHKELVEELNKQINDNI